MLDSQQSQVEQISIAQVEKISIATPRSQLEQISPLELINSAISQLNEDSPRSRRTVSTNSALVETDDF